MGRLMGRRALVTGAGSGVGRAIALRLAADGAGVAVLDLDAAAAGEVAGEIRALGRRAVAVVADVGDEAAMRDGVAAAVSGPDGIGGLEIVCASAGVQLFGRDARCHELDVDAFDATVRVNLRGMFLTCKHTLPHLMAGGGSLICIGSPTGLFGMAPGFTAYSSSKASTIGLVRVIAADYASHGVRANMVVPGFTDTPLVRAIMEDPTARVAELARIPLGRPGRAEEVGAMVSFLGSDDAAFATGAVFTVDGGATAV